MGEFALKNGERVKIGTCDKMYYLRYEDRFKVQPLSGNVNPHNELDLYWRLPLINEDFKLGSYDSHIADLEFNTDGLELELENGERGITQVKNDFGLLMNVPCYHGLQLPVIDGVKCFWNGFRTHLVISSMKNTKDDMYIIVTCRACRESWRLTIEEIEDRITDVKMRTRLQQIVKDYRSNLMKKELEKEGF